MILTFLRACCVCVLLCFTINLGYAQYWRQLTAADFRGVPRANGRGVIAYTNCTIDFKYQASRNNGEYRLHANVRLYMNTDRSWLDRSRIISEQQLAEILKHEQGHYNIAYLEQQEIISAIQRTRFTANYHAEAMGIFNRIDVKYKQLNIDYDEDTAHMVNRQQQHSWDIYFARRLQYMAEADAG